MPRYPIRARRRPGRVGLFRRTYVVGGAYVEPVAHTASPADDVAVVDEITISWIQDRTGDAVTVADSLSRTTETARVVADAVALADSATPVKSTAHTSNPADSVAAADALTISWIQDRAADAVALDDSFTRVAVYNRAPADGVLLTDQTIDAQGIRLGDTVALTDEATPDHEAAGADHERDIDDSLALADALTISWVQDRTGDTVTLADSLARVVTAARTLTDSVTLADARVFAQGEALADSVALTDSASPVISKVVSVDDSVALTDSLARAVTAVRTLTDSVTLTDARTFSQGKAVADLVALADLLSRVATALRSIDDSVALMDSAVPAEAGSGEQPINDLLQISDLFTRVATYNRSVDDSVVLADARSIGYGKPVTDTVSVEDALTITWVQDRTGDTVTITDAQAKAVGKSIADSVALTDSATPDLEAGGATHELDVDDTLTLADLLARVTVTLRTVADTIGGVPYGEGEYGEGAYGQGTGTLTDALAFAQGESIADSVALTDNLTPTNVGEGEEAVTDSVTVSDSFSRVVTYARSIADSVALTDAVTAALAQAETVQIDDFVLLSDLCLPVISLEVEVPGIGGGPGLPGLPPRRGRRRRREEILAEQEEEAIVLVLTQV